MIKKRSAICVIQRRKITTCVQLLHLIIQLLLEHT